MIFLDPILKSSGLISIFLRSLLSWVDISDIMIYSFFEIKTYNLIENNENGNLNCFTSTKDAGMTMKGEAKF